MLLDTAGAQLITINKRAASGIDFYNRHRVTQIGVQGGQGMTYGLVSNAIMGDVSIGPVPVAIDPSNSTKYADGVIGTQLFTHYCIILYPGKGLLALAQTALSADSPDSEESFHLPFRGIHGAMGIQVSILGNKGVAVLDSGANHTIVSPYITAIAKKQLSPSDYHSLSSSERIGIGKTDRTLRYTIFKVPIPIQIGNQARGGMYAICTDGIAPFPPSWHIDAILGTPFIRQFERVVIDYPNRKITFQYPPSDSDPKAAKAPPKRAFPGYQWQRIASTWVEVPVQGVPPASAPTQPATSSKLVVDDAAVASKSGSEVTVAGNSVTINKAGSGAGLAPSDLAALVPKDCDHITLAPYSFYMPKGSFFKVDPSQESFQIVANGPKVIVISAGVAYTLDVGTSVTIDGKSIDVIKAPPAQ